VNGIRVLVGCEESQEVAKAFRDLGHEAYSCDLQECSGGHPDWHLKMSVFDAIDMKDWDLGIFFPPCTYLTISANKWYKDQPKRKSGVLVGEERRMARQDAIEFFKRLYYCKIQRVAIENPVGIMSTELRRPNQVIQPWMYGHGETKATCLWLRGLPRLNGTDVVSGREQRLHRLPPSDERAKIRSKTFQGIARAMAMQWGGLITESKTA
jgi:hypothetical protein